MSSPFSVHEGADRRIFKYQMAWPIDSTFYLPYNAKVLDVGIQGTVDDPMIVIWMLVDPQETPDTERRFLAINTGPQLPEGRFNYIGTVTSPKGIVWHILEVLSSG